MANTYSQVYIQVVFAVKYRAAVLEKSWRQSVFSVMASLVVEKGCHPIIINGVEDHVHCFLSLKPSVSISDLMKTVKAKSSKYINDNQLTDQRFEWQRGFGVFSYSKSHVDRVYNYIARQEKHHQKQKFKKEYLEFLKEFDVPFDEQYIFEELI
jgi:REP element-mobilizing transposase RayT